MKKRISSAIAVTLLTGFLVGFCYVDSNRYEAKKQTITYELGAEISTMPSDYINAKETALEKSKVDISKVDETKVGTYPVTITYDGKSVQLSLKIVDTTAPILSEKDESAPIIVGKTVALATYIDVSDLAGIKSISTNEGQTQIETTETNILAAVGIKFDAAGEKKITVTAADINGNKTEIELIINVIEDYVAYVTGIQDLTVEQGSEVDWMTGITKDEKVTEIKVDAAAVDINTPGTYQLKYIIVGDDNKTTVEKTIAVTVVAPEQAQALANSGTAVKTTVGTKSAASSGNTSGGRNNSAGGSSGNNNKGSGSSGNNSRPSGGSSSGGSSSSGESNFKPGQSWEGTTDWNGTTSGGVDAEGGTWNPWG